MTATSETLRECKIQTLEEWCNAHGEPFTLIDAGGAKVANLELAKNQFIAVRTPAVFFGHLSDTIILPSSTYNYTSDDTLIYAGLTFRDYAPATDMGPFLVRPLSEKSILVRLPNDMPTVDQECIFLGGRCVAGQPNFGHFIYESMMRWAVATQIPHSASLPVVVYAGLPSRFYDFLDLLGILPARRIFIDKDVPTRFKSVWRMSGPLYMGGTEKKYQVHWWPPGVRFIHREVRARALTSNSPSRESRPILYIARGPQKWRRILNEDAVIECVKRHGGSPITLDGLSAQDQVRLVGNARAMILDSGAANAISVFAPSDCSILEFAPGTLKSFFGSLAYAVCLGQPYTRLPCQETSAAESLAAGLVMNSTLSVDSDYVVNCDKLDAYLKALPAP